MPDAWDQFPDAPGEATASDPQAADVWDQFPDAPSSSATSTNESDGGRNLALGGRAAGEGVFSSAATYADAAFNNPQIARLNPVGAMFANANVSPARMLSDAMNKIAGKQLFNADTFQDFFSQAMTHAGAPTPETSDEHLAYAAVKGAAAGATGSAAAGLAGVPNAIRAVVSGASGGTAAEVARQSGGGPLVQAIAGLAGGMAPGVVEASGRLAFNTAANLIRPMTRSGQEQIATEILKNNASDPQAAAAKLNAYQPVVAGSEQTTGAASGDIGLLALEKGVRGQNTTAFGERISEQNAARQTALSDVAGSPADVAKLDRARDVETAAMREGAFGNGAQADISPVVSKIEATLAGPVGKREVASQALNWLKGKLFDTDGNPETDPARLYAVRQDINDAIAGKLGGEQTKFKLAQGQLIQARSELDTAIEAAAPGFKAYLKRFADLSKPINQMEVMQEIRARSQSTGFDVNAQQQFIAPAQFQRALRDAMDDSNLTQLSPEQTEKLKAISADLDMSQAINSSLVKAPGSDTFQNLSIAQVIGAGRFGTNPVIRALSKSVQWIYHISGTDQDISQILARAMLNPRLSGQMLERATPASMQRFSTMLANLTRSYGIPTVSAATATQTSKAAPSDIQPSAP